MGRFSLATIELKSGPEYAAWDSKSRRTGRLHSKRSKALVEIKKRNRKEEKRAEKRAAAEQEKQGERMKARSEKSRNKREFGPGIAFLKDGDVEHIGLLGDHMQDQGSPEQMQQGERLVRIWQEWNSWRNGPDWREGGSFARLVRFAKEEWLESMIRWYCQRALEAVGVLAIKPGQSHWTDRQSMIWRQLCRRAATRARAMVREFLKAKEQASA